MKKLADDISREMDTLWGKSTLSKMVFASCLKRVLL